VTVVAVTEIHRDFVCGALVLWGGFRRYCPNFDLVAVAAGGHGVVFYQRVVFCNLTVTTNAGEWCNLPSTEIVLLTSTQNTPKSWALSHLAMGLQAVSEVVSTRSCTYQTLNTSREQALIKY
jgi:hypothetical protein